MITSFSSKLCNNNVNLGRFDEILQSLRLRDTDNSQNVYSPPYNIVKCGSDYTITMVVAGYDENNLKIEVENNKLIIYGFVEKQEDDNIELLHQGIAEYSFKRTFRLQNHMKIKGAKIKNGLLYIQLVLEIPIESKARQIPILNHSNKNKKKNIESKTKLHTIEAA